MRESPAGEQSAGAAGSLGGRGPDRTPPSLALEPRWRLDLWFDEGGGCHQWNVTGWNADGELVVMRATAVGPFDDHELLVLFAAARAYVEAFGVQLRLF